MKYRQLTAFFVASAALLSAVHVNALPSDLGVTNCSDPDWQPAECSPTPGPFEPNLGEYTVIGQDPDFQVAYDEAIDEADNLCHDFDIEKVRWTRLSPDWKVTMTIQC